MARKWKSSNINKKRILLVVRWPVGGIRTFLRYVYSRFDPEHWHFTILAPYHEEIEALRDDLKELDIDFVLTKPMPSVVSFSFAIFKQLFNQTYDLIHSQGFTSAVCSSIPSLIFHKKHLVTSHDVLNVEQFVGFPGWIKRVLLGSILRIAERIHSVSQDAQENLLSFFPRLKRQRCVVISNGIEVERFKGATAKDLRSEVKVGNVFLIGFFGRFMGQKGFRYLVDAIEILVSEKSDFPQFLVLAFGWGGFVERELRDIKARGLDRYFRFMPFESNIAGAIKGVDVVVMPSLWEAYGLLAVETLACGTPLIATNCVGLREVVRNTPTLVVPVGSGAALADGLKSYMEGGVQKKFREFVPTALKRYDVNKSVQRIESLYYNILP